MKKILIIILAVLMLSLLCGCAAKKSESTDDTTAKPSVNNTGIAYKDGVLMEVYVYTLTNYFDKDHSSENDAPNADIIHATAEFLYTQRPDKVTLADGKENVFSVSEETLLREARLLFGEDIILSDYADYISADLSDSYDSESDTYTFCYDYEKWGSGSFICAADKLAEIEESAEGFVATVYGENADGKADSIKYTFSKQVVDDYLYATLEAVEVKGE